MRRIGYCSALAALLLGGCVTAHIDYPVTRTGTTGAGRFAGKKAALAIVDKRRADKNTVSAFVLRYGEYNTGLAIPHDIGDYGQIFGPAAGKEQETYYMAPDRLYWTASGPMLDMGGQIAKHLQSAGRFASVEPLPPTTASGAVPADRFVLRLTINRFLALKERRPVADTIGFLGLSALATGREIISVDADWAVLDNGRELASGRIAFTETDRGSNFRAKNKPFKMANAAARRLTEELISAVR